MCINTGFKAAKGQLEFLLHVVENVPALEVSFNSVNKATELNGNLVAWMQTTLRGSHANF
jgi:hypothetical protein